MAVGITEGTKKWIEEVIEKDSVQRRQQSRQQRKWQGSGKQKRRQYQKVAKASEETKKQETGCVKGDGAKTADLVVSIDAGWLKKKKKWMIE